MNSLEKTARVHFNRVAQGADTHTYEEMRWSSNSRVKAQFQATQTYIERRVIPMLAETDSVLELGPGPGTWTKVLLRYRPRLRLTLTDISREMLQRATDAVAQTTTVQTIEGDFVSSTLPPDAFHVFFSSRAFEYITDKKTAVHKIYDVLHTEGKGCLITKMPKSLAHRLRGHTPSSLHQQQIAPHVLKRLLRQAGFTDIRFYPVTFSAPLLQSSIADTLCAKLFAWLPLNPLSALCVESYGVVFKKP